MKMSVGTKSLLFGYHQFILHPLVLAVAWVKLYGWPKDWRIWIAFFVHDLGYFGKPNMDGIEGETHPYFGARLMHAFFGNMPGTPDQLKWYNFMLYHSRFLARKDGQEPSQLCYADKMAIIILPTWIQVFLMRLTGEIKEYRKGKNGQTAGDGLTDSQWVEKMKQTLREWFQAEQKRKEQIERNRKLVCIRQELVECLRKTSATSRTASFSVSTFELSAHEAEKLLKHNFGDSTLCFYNPANDVMQVTFN